MVTLRFSPVRVAPPRVVLVGSDASLADFATRVREGKVVPGDWPLTPRETGSAFGEPVEWLAARTGASIACAHEAHLIQSIDEAEGEIVARYLFDATYARAHPEALEREHLELLHGTLAAKLLDEFDVILPRATLVASLRWPSIRARGTRLTRAGGRKR